MKLCQHCEDEIVLFPHPTTKKLIWQHRVRDVGRITPKHFTICRGGGSHAEPEFELSGMLVLPYGENVIPLGQNVRGVKLIKMDAEGVTVELYT